MKKVIVFLFILLTPSTMVFSQVAKGIDIPEGTYTIRSLANGGYWEKQGGGDNATNGDNIRVYDILDEARTKKWEIVSVPGSPGWYYIISLANSGSNIPMGADIAGGDTYKPGTNLQFYTHNQSYAQKFRFMHTDNNSYMIYTADGLVVKVNGEYNVEIGEQNSSKDDEWLLSKKNDYDEYNWLPWPLKEIDAQLKLNKGVYYFKPGKKYHIQSGIIINPNDKDLGYLEFPEYTDWKQLQVWTKDENTNKHFEFKLLPNGYYNIAAVDGKGVVDCRHGDTKNGTALQYYTHSSGNLAQQFYVIAVGVNVFKIFHRSGKILCLANNTNHSNGNQVHLWDNHDLPSTKWFIKEVE